MAFTIDRVEAARRLWVSTRTVDRYIQAGRIATKRIGKKIFLDDDNVETIRSTESGQTKENYEVVYDTPTQEVVTHDMGAKTVNYQRLYSDAQAIIAKKDEVIQDLSYRLGKSESELKHSIPAVEYKKATFLLESAKSKTDEEVHIREQKVLKLTRELDKRNVTIFILALLLIFVLIFAAILFFSTFR